MIGGFREPALRPGFLRCGPAIDIAYGVEVDHLRYRADEHQPAAELLAMRRDADTRGPVLAVGDVEELRHRRVERDDMISESVENDAAIAKRHQRIHAVADVRGAGDLGAGVDIPSPESVFEGHQERAMRRVPSYAARAAS